MIGLSLSFGLCRMRTKGELINFYPRDASWRGYSCRRVSVCLSVCVSVKSRCSTETAKRMGHANNATR